MMIDNAAMAGAISFAQFRIERECCLKRACDHRQANQEDKGQDLLPPFKLAIMPEHSKHDGGTDNVQHKPRFAKAPVQISTHQHATCKRND